MDKLTLVQNRPDGLDLSRLRRDARPMPARAGNYQVSGINAGSEKWRWLKRLRRRRIALERNAVVAAAGVGRRRWFQRRVIAFPDKQASRR